MNNTTTNSKNDESGSEHERWKARANEKYGTAVVAATAHLYRGRYEEMLQDDNILGAIPTLTLAPNIPCPWRGNTVNYCFVCVLVALQFYREDNELRLYLDARGEPDLRHPQDSSVVRRDSSTKDEDSAAAASTSSSSTSSPLAFFNDDISTLISGEFVSEISVPGHFKGYLAFDAGVFAKKGKYYFTFADVRRNPSFRRMMAMMEARGAPATALVMLKDYPDMFLLEVPEDQGLAQAFRNQESGKTHYTAVSSSPFEQDTEDTELQRFAPFVDPAVLTRHVEEKALDRDSTKAPVAAAQEEDEEQVAYNDVPNNSNTSSSNNTRRRIHFLRSITASPSTTPHSTSQPAASLAATGPGDAAKRAMLDADAKVYATEIDASRYPTSHPTVAAAAATAAAAKTRTIRKIVDASHAAAAAAAAPTRTIAAAAAAGAPTRTIAAAAATRKRKNTKKWWIGPNDTLDTTPGPQRVLLHVPGSKKGGVMLNLK